MRFIYMIWIKDLNRKHLCNIQDIKFYNYAQNNSVIFTGRKKCYSIELKKKCKQFRSKILKTKVLILLFFSTSFAGSNVNFVPSINNFFSLEVHFELFLRKGSKTRQKNSPLLITNKPKQRT